MWDFDSELFARPAQRYTCFPTPVAFHNANANRDHRLGLATIGADEPVSIYVHIPFCKRICTYCACNTGDANRSLALAAYLSRLHQEIELVARAINGRGRISRISFGGGSPNSIAPCQFTRLVCHMRDAFAPNHELDLSVGIDPRCMTAEFADALSSAGVRSASLGAPTFDIDIQLAIGRLQPFEKVERATSLLRDAGVSSLGLELLFGLPMQCEATLLSSLLASVTLHPDRLSLLGYVHLPQQRAHQRRIEASSLPNARARFAQFQAGHDWLVERGWIAIGYNEFAQSHDPIALAARQRRLRRNFHGFTDDRNEIVIGMGASAISRFQGALVQNERSNSKYCSTIGSGALAASRSIVTTPEIRLRGQIIEHLLCRGEADIGRLPDHATVRDAMKPFEAAQLVKWSGRKLAFLPGAEAYAEQIAATLDPWSATLDQKRSARKRGPFAKRLVRSIPMRGDRIGSTNFDQAN